MKSPSKFTNFALFKRLKFVFWVSFVVCAIVIPVLFNVFNASAYSWSAADVATENEGYFASLKYDGSGNQGIVYTQDAGTDYYIYYAYYNGSWNFELVDNSSSFEYAGLVFDSNSIPRIAYYDLSNGNLIYARRGASGTTTSNPANGTGESDCTDTDWNKTTIESSGDVGDHAFIAIDDDDNVGIAYQYGTSADLRYARYVGASGTGCDTSLATWSCENIYTTNTAGGNISLAFSGNTAVIASQVTTPTSYMFVATRDGNGTGVCDAAGANNTSWNCPLIDSCDAMQEKRNISVGVGAGGVIGVAYTSAAYDLRYAYNTASDPATCSESSAWTCETADANSATDKFKNWITLIFANQMVPNIVYFDSYNGDAFFAEKVSGSWNSETILTTNSVGHYASLARTSSTNGVAFFDDTSDDLMYASSSITYNSAPTVSLGSTSQSGDGLGKITIVASVEDYDFNDTRLKVEYSDDGGSNWYDPYLDSATPNSGSVDLNNANEYQIGETNKIDTSGGAITVTVVWDTQSASNGNGALTGTDQSDIKLRFTANDSTIDSTATASANFEVDNLSPSGGLTVLATDTTTTTSVNLDWTAITTETNWTSSPSQAHYEIWYGHNQTNVQSRTSGLSFAAVAEIKDFGTELKNALSLENYDLDGDGDIDIVTGGNFGLAWFENNGFGSFTEHELANSASNPNDIYFIDLDEDSDVDILTADYTNDLVSWFENDGSENFTKHDITNSFVDPFTLEAGDLDEDGDVDVAVASSADSGTAYLAWYQNNGSEVFSMNGIASAASSFRILKIADVDDDSDNDLVGSYASGEPNFFWWENNGSGTFSAHSIQSGSVCVVSLDVLDLDVDGDEDIVGTDCNVQKIAYWLNNGSETFTKTQALSVTSNPILGNVVDMDNDGDYDFVYADIGEQDILVGENSALSFSPISVDADFKAFEEESIKVADYNGDGFYDIAAITDLAVGSRLVWWENKATVNEWDNDNDGNLTTKATATTTITDLDPNILYYFKIWAIDSFGNEMTVDDVNVYTYANAPTAPTISLPSDGDSTKLQVVVNGNSNPESTEYAIKVTYGVNTKYVQADGSLGDSAVWQNYFVWGGALGQTVSGLTGNTQYNFQVKARNGNNVETAFGAEASKYTYATNASGLALTDGTTSSDYKLSFVFTNNGATGFKIDRDTGCDALFETNVYNETNAIPSSPRVFSGLAANTCYKYRISVYNSEGILNTISYAESAEITTPPAQPTGLTVSAATVDSITLDWDTVEAATDYNIYLNDDTLVATINAAADEYTAESLNSNASYTYYVRAENGNGEGLKSSNVTGYTKADAPTNLSITNIYPDAVRWTWQSGGAQTSFFARSENPIAVIDDWTTNLYWDQSSLTENNLTTVYVKAKNENDDETAEASISRYSGMGAPGGLNFSSVGVSSITVQAVGTFTNLTSGSSGLYFSNEVSDSGWIKVNNWASDSLSPNTFYNYDAAAKNGDGVFAVSEGFIPWDNSLYTLHPDPTDIEITNLATTSITIDLADTLYNIDQGDSGLYFSNNTQTVNSDWIKTNSWTSSDLTPNTAYEFSAKARNGDAVETAIVTETFFTAQATPTDLLVSDLTAESFTVVADGLTSPQSDGVFFNNTTLGVNSGWDENSFAVVGLSANTGYTITVKARNGDDVETGVYSEEIYSAQTVPVLTQNTKTSTSITLDIGNTSNLSAGSSGVYIENTTRGTNSGWLTTTGWQETGLSSRTSYTYRAKARNGNGEETAWSADLTIMTSGGSAAIIPIIIVPDTVYQCNDGVDNDADGKVDMNDLGCSAYNDNNEGDEPVVYQCNDGLDNDNDGKIDYPDDVGCSSAEDDLEYLYIPLVLQCSDKKDNDNDGLIDMMDPGCESYSDPLEGDPPVKKCADNLDNDGDGKIDLLDPGCSDSNDDDEQDPLIGQCNDKIDNDHDGKTDYPEDSDCSSAEDDTEFFVLILLECLDGKDNDGDGKIDLLDPGCSMGIDPSEKDAETPPACSDEIDNDNDGKIDLEDQGCSSVGDLDETDPQCLDGLDNDGDGAIDMNDFGCENLTDNNESDEPIIYQCNDKIDNDGDGQVDLLDQGCSDKNDQTEFGETMTRPLIVVPSANWVSTKEDKLLVAGSVFYPNMQIDIMLGDKLVKTVFSQNNKSFATEINGFQKGNNSLYLKTKNATSLTKTVYFDNENPPLPTVEKIDISYNYIAADKKYVSIIAVSGASFDSVYVQTNGFLLSDYSHAFSGQILVKNNQWANSFTRDNLPEGEYRLNFRSRDLVGNFSAWGTLTFAIKYPITTDLNKPDEDDNGADGEGDETENSGDDSTGEQNDFYSQIVSDETMNEIKNDVNDLLAKPMVKNSLDQTSKFISRIINVENEETQKNILAASQKVVEFAKVFSFLTIDNPLVEKVNKVAQTPAVAATAATTVLAVATVGTTGAAGVSVLTYLQFLFTQPLLLFARKNKNNWGVVYDSVTKKPVGLAVIRLYNAVNKQLIRTAVTDKNGRYHFVVNPGRYYLVAEKSEMKFPDVLLRQSPNDVGYANLYYGGEFEVTGKQAITKTIPIEPNKKKVEANSLIRKQLLIKAQSVLSFIGPILAATSFIINPKAWVGAVAILQFGSYLIFKKLAFREKGGSLGFVKDSEDKRPISRAMVRVFDCKFNKLLDSCLTDNNGNFAFLASSGEYYLTADKKGYFEKRTERIDLREKEQGFLQKKIFIQPIGDSPTKIAESDNGEIKIVRSRLGRSKEKIVNGIKKIIYNDEEKYQLNVSESEENNLHEDYYSVDVLKKD